MVHRRHWYACGSVPHMAEPELELSREQMSAVDVWLAVAEKQEHLTSETLQILLTGSAN